MSLHHLFGGSVRASVGVSVSFLTQDIELEIASSTIHLFSPQGEVDRTVSLPNVGRSNGFYFILKNHAPPGAPSVLVSSNGDVIGSLEPGEGVIVACDGVSWHTVIWSSS